MNPFNEFSYTDAQRENVCTLHSHSAIGMQVWNEVADDKLNGTRDDGIAVLLLHAELSAGLERAVVQRFTESLRAGAQAYR